MFRKFLLTAAVAVAVALVAPAASQADFILTLNDGVGDSVKIDIGFSGGNTTANVVAATGNLSTLTSPALSNLQLNGASLAAFNVAASSFQSNSSGTKANIINTVVFEGFTFQLQSGSSNFTGTSAMATIKITLNTLTSNSASPGSITASLLEGGFQMPTGVNGFLTGETDFNPSNVGGTFSGTAEYNDPGFSGTIPSGLNTINTSAAFPVHKPFSLTTSVTVSGALTGTLNNVGTTTDLYSGTPNVPPTPFISTPAPAGLILAATMVPFFGLLRRRLSRMAKETTVVA